MSEETKEEVQDHVPEKTEHETEEGAEREKLALIKPLDKMTTPELKEAALEIPGLSGVSAMKKEELQAVLREYLGIEEEAPVKKAKMKSQGPSVSVKELKGKIVQLRGQKKEARKAKDREKTDILRRRINRLKKMTRKVAQA